MNPIAAIATSTNRQPDGSVNIVLQVEPEDATEVMRHLNQANTTAAIALVQTGRYGKHAQALKLSGFFRSPDVWRAIGSDEKYQAWTRKQPCVVTKMYDWDGDKGEGRCDYCHVRRAADAGTGIKPEYMGVPMVHQQHHLQHNGGELAALYGFVASVRNEEQARAWFNRAAMTNVQKWGWETLKGQLQFESWSEVPPRILYQWAAANNVSSLLPKCYRPQ